MLKMKGFPYTGSYSPSAKIVLSGAPPNDRCQDIVGTKYITFLEIHLVHLKNCSLIMVLGRPDLQKWYSSVGLFTAMRWSSSSDPVTGLKSVCGSC